MKKLFTLLTIALCALSIVSCSSQSTPKKVTETFIKHLQKENYEAITDMFYCKGNTEVEIKQSRQMINSLFTDKVDKEMDKKEGIKSYEIKDEIIDEDGTSAVVSYTLTFGNGETEDQKCKLINIDDKWYLDLGK